MHAHAGDSGSKGARPVLRVLHADDDETFQLLVRRVVEGDPGLAATCDLRLVADGSEAVAYIRGTGPYADRDAHPLPHLVLLDQRMTKMDGTEALRAIREEEDARHIPVFLLSTSDQESLSREFLSLGGSFCVRKPLDFVEFKRRFGLLLEFASEVLELQHRK